MFRQDVFVYRDGKEDTERQFPIATFPLPPQSDNHKINAYKENDEIKTNNDTDVFFSPFLLLFFPFFAVNRPKVLPEQGVVPKKRQPM